MIVVCYAIIGVIKIIKSFGLFETIRVMNVIKVGFVRVIKLP